MNTIILNTSKEEIIGASLYAPVPREDLYEVLLDAGSFPRWAPGVRRVEIVEGRAGPGMVSEWEVSVLGMRRKISSVLLAAEPPSLLRWSYEGPIRGWGECSIREQGNGTLVSFVTGLEPEDPGLAILMRATPFQNAARAHLKRCLGKLGQVVSEDDERVRVGPLERA